LPEISCSKDLNMERNKALVPADALCDLDIERVGRNLVVHDERKLFPRRQLAGFANRQRPRHIHRHRLGHVDVAPRFHGGPCLLGIEARYVDNHDRFRGLAWRSAKQRAHSRCRHRAADKLPSRK